MYVCVCERERETQREERERGRERGRKFPKNHQDNIIDGMTESGSETGNIPGFEDEGRGPQTKKKTSRSWKRQGNVFSPRANTLHYPYETHVRLLT